MGGTGRVNTRERVSSIIEVTPGLLLWIDIVQQQSIYIYISKAMTFQSFHGLFHVSWLGFIVSFCCKNTDSKINVIHGHHPESSGEARILEKCGSK